MFLLRGLPKVLATSFRSELISSVFPGIGKFSALLFLWARLFGEQAAVVAFASSRQADL